MQPPSTGKNHVVNHYSILGLPQPHARNSNQFSKDELKSAYHRALLLHHPDKAVKHNSSLRSVTNGRGQDSQYSIDEIMRAYQTLAEPVLRTAYDDQLFKNESSVVPLDKAGSQNGTHLGVEDYDLEDMDYNEEGKWHKSCRCGDEEGYTVTETELERESHMGEIYVGCRGCSLFIKILFGLAEN